MVVTAIALAVAVVVVPAMAPVTAVTVTLVVAAAVRPGTVNIAGRHVIGLNVRPAKIQAEKKVSIGQVQRSSNGGSIIVGLGLAGDAKGKHCSH
jgi:hypothetical protein